MDAAAIQLTCDAFVGVRRPIKLYFNPSSPPQLRFRPCSLCASPLISSIIKIWGLKKPPVVIHCLDSSTPPTTSTEAEELPEVTTAAPTSSGQQPLRMKRTRMRYRKQYPGEKEGITEEMRFVAMKLRNVKYKVKDSEVSDKVSAKKEDFDGKDKQGSIEDEEDGDGGDDNGDSWKPSMEGFLKYLVDNKLVFGTVERIVDESSDVSYAYFRKTGLERTGGLLKDLEWFREQDLEIPDPSNAGITYANYLEELAEKSPPLFLCHFYNIFFSHIAGGQVIVRKVSKNLLEGRELEFYRWEKDPEELMKGVREKLNMLAEHWPRHEKNSCLREATKSFRYLGQIARLIVL